LHSRRKTRECYAPVPEKLASRYLLRILVAQILCYFEEFPSSKQIFLVMMNHAATLTLHNLRFLLEVKLHQLQRALTVKTISGMLLLWFVVHSKPRARLCLNGDKLLSLKKPEYSRTTGLDSQAGGYLFSTGAFCPSILTIGLDMTSLIRSATFIASLTRCITMLRSP